MPDVSDALRAKALLMDAEFRFSRALGQNFLLDDGMNAHIADLARCDRETNVLEIGPGAGTLTCALARTSKKVLSVEIDRRLEDILHRMLEGFDNVELLFGDIMKQGLPALVKEHFGDEPYMLVANLPYAIAADLLPKAVSLPVPPCRTVVMVQREAAERVCAQPGQKIWCALSARMQYFADVSVADILPAHAFTPNAHVESALLLAEQYLPEERPAQPKNPALYLRMIDAAFAMRRKTLANNLTASFSVPRETAVSALEKAGLSPTIRGEVLTLEQLASVTDALEEML